MSDLFTMQTQMPVQKAGGMELARPSHRDAQVVKGAQEFEAMMLQEMLKPMHFGSSPEQDGDDSAGGAGDTMRGLGMEALTKSIAIRGGLGLARTIVKQVLKERDALKEITRSTKVL